MMVWVKLLKLIYMCPTNIHGGWWETSVTFSEASDRLVTGKDRVNPALPD